MSKQQCTYKSAAQLPRPRHSVVLFEVDHPKLGECAVVRTSIVVSYDAESGAIETLNSIYKRVEQ